MFEWNSYCFLKFCMQFIWDVFFYWCVICNFLIDKINFCDYICVLFVENDFFVVFDINVCCVLYEFVNICGNMCRNCMVYFFYGLSFGYYIDSWWQLVECDFDGRLGGIEDEDNFGEYGYVNLVFCCLFLFIFIMEFWIGGFK